MEKRPVSASTSTTISGTLILTKLLRKPPPNIGKERSVQETHGHNGNVFPVPLAPGAVTTEAAGREQGGLPRTGHGPPFS